MVGPWSCSPASGLHTSSRSFGRSCVPSLIVFFFSVLLFLLLVVILFCVHLFPFVVCRLFPLSKGGKRGARKIYRQTDRPVRNSEEKEEEREVWDPTLCCRSALLLVFAYFLFISLSSVLNVVAVEIFWGAHLASPNPIQCGVKRSSWSRAVVVKFVKNQCMNRDRRS